jgi:nitrate reductase NapD
LLEPAILHISSAVVTALPQHADQVVARIESLPDTEVHYRSGSKIVIVMEAGTTGEIGGRLAEIALMDGVISANLVFEQIDMESPGAQS